MHFWKMPKFLQNVANTLLLNMDALSDTITSGNPLLAKMLYNIFTVDADMGVDEQTPTSDHLEFASTTIKN